MSDPAAPVLEAPNIEPKIPEIEPAPPATPAASPEPSTPPAKNPDVWLGVLALAVAGAAYFLIFRKKPAPAAIPAPEKKSNPEFIGFGFQ